MIHTVSLVRRVPHRSFATVAFRQHRRKTCARWNSDRRDRTVVTCTAESSCISFNAPRIDGLGAKRKSWRMVKAVLLAALVFVAPAQPALTQDTKVSVGMTGIGALSCVHWRSTNEHLAEGTVWIYGFWTGLNYVAAASDQAQSGTDATQIVAEVKKTCALVPSQTLANAVWTTYLEANKR
jgi:hypothetical protein